MPHGMPAHKFLLPAADTCTCLMKHGVLDFIYWALLREMVLAQGPQRLAETLALR
ncbi:unnamed protein product [Brassica rapa subsp. trilocularis]|uniref:(rape) hypothetical protein n=1 Tax=Brassica napus TaxID=3708 RepID=A0A078HIS8_BRANA|nr:unnamed protein product [Brassica napus]CDY37767.1 BnaA10g05540D [Brassica napus]